MSEIVCVSVRVWVIKDEFTCSGGMIREKFYSVYMVVFRAEITAARMNTMEWQS